MKWRHVEIKSKKEKEELIPFKLFDQPLSKIIDKFKMVNHKASSHLFFFCVFFAR